MVVEYETLALMILMEMHIENIVRKGENTGNQRLLFSHFFFYLSKIKNHLLNH